MFISVHHLDFLMNYSANDSIADVELGSRGEAFTNSIVSGNPFGIGAEDFGFQVERLPVI